MAAQLPPTTLVMTRDAKFVWEVFQISLRRNRKIMGAYMIMMIERTDRVIQKPIYFPNTSFATVEWKSNQVGPNLCGKACWRFASKCDQLLLDCLPFAHTTQEVELVPRMGTPLSIGSALEV